MTCPKHTYFYIDESNIAITASARPICAEHSRMTDPGATYAPSTLDITAPAADRT